MASAYILVIVCGLVALAYGVVTSRSVLAANAGSARMQEISGAVQVGASAYLNRQYRTIAIVGVVILIILGVTLGLWVALGYLIGAVLYDSVGLWLIHLYGYGDKVEAFREAYAQWGAWIILLKGLTPIPYKIVTIASGFAGYNLFLFVVLSIITRGARFFLLAFLLNRYGAQARSIIEERLGFWVSAGAVLLIGGIVAALYLF